MHLCIHLSRHWTVFTVVISSLTVCCFSRVSELSLFVLKLCASLIIMYCLLQVMFDRLFSTKSVSESGTLYQIRNLLHRTAVPIDPGKNMKAAEDFLLLVLHAHIVAAAKGLLHSESFSGSSPSPLDVARAIVDTHLLLPTSSQHLSSDASTDGVTLYARELITLSLLWHCFHDATKEADGERILLCWKIMYPPFRATRHRNYAKESILLLLQSNYFSDRMRSQLLWSRCINTKGRVETNIPCDLHLEHLNRRLKTVLRSMGANISPDAIVRAVKALHAVHNVCLRFEEETCSSTRSAHSDIHRVPSFGEDFVSLLTLLIDNNVFEPQQNRYHPSFAFKKGLLQHFTREELLKHITSIVSSNV